MISIKEATDLQAFVDGELPADEAGAVARRIQADGHAQALCDELRTTRGLLRGAEVPAQLEHSREFYWAGIRRAIEQAERKAQPAPTPLGWMLRSWRLLAGACAVLAAAAYLSFPRERSADRPEAWLAVDQEIETPLENASTFSFRSESARMTVVWVDTQVN